MLDVNDLFKSVQDNAEVIPGFKSLEQVDNGKYLMIFDKRSAELDDFCIMAEAFFNVFKPGYENEVHIILTSKQSIAQPAELNEDKGLSLQQLRNELIQGVKIQQNEFATHGRLLEMINYALSIVDTQIEKEGGDQRRIKLPVAVVDEVVEGQPYTTIEKEVSLLIVEAHNKFMSLKLTHPTEQQEWCQGIHALQNVLAFRTLRRDYPKEFNSLK